MLKFNSGAKGEPAKIVASGSTLDIVTDIGQMIVGIHSQLRKSCPADAAVFQAAVRQMVNDPEIHLWDMDVQAAFGMAMSVPKKEGAADGA